MRGSKVKLVAFDTDIILLNRMIVIIYDILKEKMMNNRISNISVMYNDMCCNDHQFLC